jgi:hypothetical protein
MYNWMDDIKIASNQRFIPSKDINLPFSTAFRLNLEPTWLPAQCVPQALSLGKKAATEQAHH